MRVIVLLSVLAVVLCGCGKRDVLSDKLKTVKESYDEKKVGLETSYIYDANGYYVCKRLVDTKYGYVIYDGSGVFVVPLKEDKKEEKKEEKR